jgi:hypothetical protein
MKGLDIAVINGVNNLIQNIKNESERTSMNIEMSNYTFNARTTEICCDMNVRSGLALNLSSYRPCGLVGLQNAINTVVAAEESKLSAASVYFCFLSHAPFSHPGETNELNFTATTCN